MEVTLQLKVPVDLAVDLKERLRALQTAHTAQIQRLKERNAKGDEARLKLLYRQSTLLTINNIVRVALVHGAANVVLMKDDAIVQHISEVGRARGRPKSP